MPPAPVALPIDRHLPNLVASLAQAPALVLCAEPGAGKTTRLPPALLAPEVSAGKEVWVLQPRRLATRLAAARVAEERGEPVGRSVGYQVRFESVGGPQTRLRFLTEGVLTRKLLADPDLREVGVVVLDEFHERHLTGDLALALLRRLQRTSRPDLKLAVMSATLDPKPIAEFLGGAPIFQVEGRKFEVTVEPLESPDARPLHVQVLAALKRGLAAGIEGHVLVFLPGAKEIRLAASEMEEFAARHALDVLTLHGDLPAAEQDRAVRPSTRRKVILSTNVAETSVTIDGVGWVVDSGLARIASHSPWSGMPSLELSEISRASAVQRAGRAGRTRAGVCMRLFTQSDFERRPPRETPEIRRADLAELVLTLHGAGVGDLGSFPFFEPPPSAALEAACTLLARLGAIREGQLTELGRRMSALPVHPRSARILMEAERRKVGREAALAVALLSERDLRRAGNASRRTGASASGRSDLLALSEAFHDARRIGRNPRALLAEGIDPAAFAAVDRARGQLERHLRASGGSAAPEAREDALLISILAGYPDRVARRRRPHDPEVLLSGGGAARLSETSVVRDSELLVALDVEKRDDRHGVGKSSSGPRIRLASEIEPEWLLDLFPDRLRDEAGLSWNAAAERVERWSRLSYDAIALDETSAPAPADEETSRLLAAQARKVGLSRFVDPDALAAWVARLELLARNAKELSLPTPDEAFLSEGLEAACEGLRAFATLREVPILALLESRLPAEGQRALATLTPERIPLGPRRAVKVHYVANGPPWIESRLQDFFGMSEGPSVCRGRVPLVLHLLAPNGRAVQVTSDLRGFWERHYPAIRRELSRRYPRHAWPERPTGS